MAPKFKKLIYITQSGQQGTTAFVGFPVEQLKYKSIFRDSLSEEITKTTGYKHKKTTGVYEDVDVDLDFFENKDSEIIDAFYSKPYPGCSSWLFRTRYYKSIFTENELAQFIEKVAQNLKLQIHKSRFQYSISEIIMSNKLLDDD